MSDQRSVNSKQGLEILNHLVEVVMQVDRNLRIVWGNRAAAAAGRTTAANLPGKTCYEVWRAAGSECSHCPVRQAMEEKHEVTSIMPLPGGRYWRVTGSPLFDDQGEVLGAIETALDITEQATLEMQLRQERQELSHLVAHIPGVIVRLDSDLRLRFISDQARFYQNRRKAPAFRYGDISRTNV